MRDRLAGSQRTTEVKAIADYSYKMSSFSGDGYCLVGDAACFLDPVFSTGVLMAMTSGSLAADTVARALATKGRVDAADFRRFEKIYRRGVARFTRFVHGFYEPAMLETFYTRAPIQIVERAVTTVLGGRRVLPDAARTLLRGDVPCLRLPRRNPAGAARARRVRARDGHRHAGDLRNKNPSAALTDGATAPTKRHRQPPSGDGDHPRTTHGGHAMRTTLGMIGLAAAGLALAGCATTQAPQRDAKAMTFFVTSTGPGKGADLGGLAGADQHCQKLAHGGRRRAAHLARLPQHPGARGPNFVNARDRIGNGPWQNINGVVIARRRRRAARAGEQAQQADGGRREGRHRERPQREAEHARHPDGLAARRHRVRRRAVRGHDVRQLDQERRGGLGDARPPRPHRADRHGVGEIVELVAPRAAAAIRKAS